MTTLNVEFVPATLALRPPRVAVMVPETDAWRNWMMRSLAIASEYWGGGGFIMVPYSRETAEPSPKFRDAVRAYDPDHVVVLRVPAKDFEAWHPGEIRFNGVKDEEERQSLIKRIHEDVDDPSALAARERVVAWCSPLRSFRHRGDAPARPRETVTTLQQPRRDDGFSRGLPLAPLRSEEPRLAASAGWRSDAALFAAARVGVARSETTERNDPDDATFGWLIAANGGPPGALIWAADPESLKGRAVPEPWFHTGQGLMKVSRGYVEDAAAVVVGDTAADFALALAYDRILGRGVWIPSRLVNGPALDNDVRAAVWRLISEVEQSARHVIVTTTSLSQAELGRAAERLKEQDLAFQPLDGIRQQVDETETVQVRPANLERGFTHLVANEHVGVSIIVPMAVAEDGTREAMVGLESPIPAELLYTDDLGKLPYWYVDVAFARDNSPRGRDLPSSTALRIDDGLFTEVNVRASQHGFTYDPTSMGFVAGGTLLPGRLGRPRLRALSMHAWVEGMAEASGLGVRLSMPGRHAELVRRRLGTRGQLTELVASPALPVLRSFIPELEAPKTRDPDRIVLGLEPYLSLGRMVELHQEDEGAVVRLIDELTGARLMRRGLVLGCEECGRPSFLDADRVGQQYECPQCATTNTLVSARWRIGAEPRWFYDLHATFRELLKDNGDVPLLAAARLRATSRTYVDSSELEFFDLDTGKMVAEIDVIASADQDVVIVEAKSNGEFPNRARAAQTRKLLRVAEALRADRIVLATSRERWKAADVEHVAREAGRVAPFPLRVDAMTELGA